MSKLVRPGGHLVTLIYPVMEKEGGPPFQVKVEDIEAIILKNGFHKVHLEPVPKEMSFPDRGGKEFIGIWKKD